MHRWNVTRTLLPGHSARRAPLRRVSLLFAVCCAACVIIVATTKIDSSRDPARATRRVKTSEPELRRGFVVVAARELEDAAFHRLLPFALSAKWKTKTYHSRSDKTLQPDPVAHCHCDPAHIHETHGTEIPLPNTEVAVALVSECHSALFKCEEERTRHNSQQTAAARKQTAQSDIG